MAYGAQRKKGDEDGQTESTPTMHNKTMVLCLKEKMKKDRNCRKGHMAYVIMKIFEPLGLS